jgi:hypothetical protein
MDKEYTPEEIEKSKRFIKQVEKVIGRHILSKDELKVPGTNYTDKRKILYFSDNGKKHKFKTQFFKLMMFAKPSHATHGGGMEQGCKITIPDGLVFHAFSYGGDLDGWRKNIEIGAKGLGLLLAWIEGDQFTLDEQGYYLPKTDKKYFDNNKFVISDGRSFMLSECKIEMY